MTVYRNRDFAGPPASYYDPPDDGPECPQCGEAVEGDKYEGACTNEECDYSYEADYEAIIEARRGY